MHVHFVSNNGNVQFHLVGRGVLVTYALIHPSMQFLK